MQSRERVVLLTGFGPFPGVPENVTAKLVPILAQRARAAFPHLAFHTEILVTAWESAPERAAALIAEHRPVLALHFGVAREAHGFRLERTAQNMCRLAADVSGILPSAAHLDHAGPATRTAGIDTEALCRHLDKLGYPVSLSDDAGAYLCNAVLYHSLGAAQALTATSEPACRSGFIHLPTDLSGPPLTLPEAIDGALEIIAHCLTQIERDGARSY